MRVEKGSLNVYADLGFPDADEMLVKAQLATKIGEMLRSRKLVQQEAARLLNISQPKLSNLLRGNFRGISEMKMLECLARLGSDVRIVVDNKKRQQITGRLSVVFA
jgi:predicted XRE-type DNA-binding protein